DQRHRRPRRGRLCRDPQARPARRRHPAILHRRPDPARQRRRDRRGPWASPRPRRRLRCPGGPGPQPRRARQCDRRRRTLSIRQTRQTYSLKRSSDCNRPRGPSALQDGDHRTPAWSRRTEWRTYQKSVDIWNRLISNDVRAFPLTMGWGAEGQGGPTARAFAREGFFCDSHHRIRSQLMSNTSDKMKEGIHDAAEKVKDVAHNVGEKVKDAAHNVAEKTKDAAHNVAEKTKDIVRNVGEKIKDAGRNVGEKIKDAGR